MKKAWILIACLIGAIMVARKKIPAVTDAVIEKMAQAIKTFEGWTPGSRSYRNNNPGNLKYAGQAGATGQDDQGHAIFDSYASGWNALIRQLKLAFYGGSSVYSPSMSLYAFFQKYAEGNSLQYAEYVAGQIGASAEATLQSLLG
jgi:hypothetical protein